MAEAVVDQALQETPTPPLPNALPVTGTNPPTNLSLKFMLIVTGLLLLYGAYQLKKRSY
jgi:hypothetical protein